MSKHTEAIREARPILFSAPMVRAILDGRKTQTRRICKPQPYSNGFHFDGRDIQCHNDYLPPSAMLMEVGRGRNKYTTSNYEGWAVDCPYGAPGDRLWVRESLRPTRCDRGYIVDWHYAADGAKVPRCPDLKPQFNDGMAFAHLARAGVPSIHMPRWASRITLEITDVRVERLQEISEDDCVAEGVNQRWTCISPGAGSYAHENDVRDDYRSLWERINGADSWDANPWVWCVSFCKAKD